MAFVVERVGDDQDGVLVPATGHADIQRLGGQSRICDKDRPVDGDALGLVDGEGVAERDVLGGVVGWRGSIRR